MNLRRDATAQPTAHPSGPARLPRALLAVVLLAMAAGGCARSEEDWLEATHDEDPFVRSLAVVALGQSMWEAPGVVAERLIQTLGDSDREVAGRSGEALLRHQRDVLPYMLRQAGWPDAGIRQLLEMLVLRLGQEAVPDLREALAEPSPPAGAYLVDLLQKLGPAGADALLDASRHSDERVRRAALTALAADGRLKPAAVQRLLEAVEDPSPPLRALALQILVRESCRQLEYPDPVARADAAERLRSFGGVGVREVTRLLLDQDSPNLARPARRWLSTCQLSDVPAFLAAHHGGTAEMTVPELLSLCENITLFGAPAVPVLRRELTVDDPARRVAAAAALGGLGTAADGAVPDLLQSLEDGDDNVRMTAALALSLIGITDKAAVDTLAARALRLDMGGDERFARALGTAAIGGLLRELAEDAPPAAAREAALTRLAAWGPSGRAWLDQVATHALTEELQLRAQETLTALDSRAEH